MKIQIIEKEFIFEEENAATEAVHASTVAFLKDKTVCSAWFGGTKESADDVRIWFSLKKDNKWTTPISIPGNEEIPHWNPVLFVNEKNEIFLYYKVGKTIENWKTFLTVSHDGGKTFDEPFELVPGDIGGRGPVKNKILVLSDGRLLAPASIEKSVDWRCFIDMSFDGGLNFEKHEIPLPDEKNEKNAVIAMIQPTLWESKNGKVHALLRTNMNYAYRTDSNDYGVTWCMPYITDVPNNNSGLDLAKNKNGFIALVSNPVAENAGKRTPLTVAISNDNGISFAEAAVLEDGEGEFSYPAIIDDEDTFHITYTYKRKTIVYALIKIEK